MLLLSQVYSSVHASGSVQAAASVPLKIVFLPSQPFHGSCLAWPLRNTHAYLSPPPPPPTPHPPLAQGHMIYYGQGAAAAGWFGQLGVPLPYGVNVADFILVGKL